MTKAPSEEEKLQGKWHVDKTIPLPLLFAIAVQTAGAVWWASSLSSRVSALERSDENRSGQTSQLTTIAVDIAVLKENLKSTKEDVSSIKTSFEALLQQALQEKTKR